MITRDIIMDCYNECAFMPDQRSVDFLSHLQKQSTATLGVTIHLTCSLSPAVHIIAMRGCYLFSPEN